MTERTCSIEGCEKRVFGYGWCNMHYSRWRKWGDPHYTTKVVVMNGTPEERFWAHVDKSGDCWVWVGGKARGGYGAFGTNGSVVPAHRFAYELASGQIPDGLWIDHICRNPPCVNPDHLRLATPTQNNQYRRPRAGTVSGFKGVSWHGPTNSWHARIVVNGKPVSLAYFRSPEEAARAYDHAARERFGKFALTNFPD